MPMSPISHFNLQRHNTLNVPSFASCAYIVNTIEDILSLPSLYDPIIIGGGSNVIFTKRDIKSPVIINRIGGIDIIKKNASHALVKVGAGEGWDEFIDWCCSNHFSGLENLALIPGTVGAAPIQNIGAYGVEVCEYLDSVEYLDLRTQKICTIDHSECQFSYRNSIFKNTLKDSIIIISVTFRLDLHFKPNLTYQGIAESLNKQSITQEQLNSRQLIDTIRLIRKEKLPNPHKQPNAGSFFHNPIISLDRYSALKGSFPDLPGYRQANNRVKISAAWLIENAGLKGFSKGNVKISELHALVLVNHGEASGNEILAFATYVIDTVKHKFDIRLNIEPIQI